MWAFNLVVTLANDGRFRRLLHQLAPHGEFRKTEFLGVILGQVDDPHRFLETVRRMRSEQGDAFPDLGRAIPLTRDFTFRAETFVEKACEAIRPWLPELADGRFYVRLERRGLKGRIVSPEAERAVDAFIETELARTGQGARIDFADPDAVVVIETFGDRAGVALLTRELRRDFDFVRVD